LREGTLENFGGPPSVGAGKGTLPAGR
jgi:hypothetical protein